MTAKTARYDMHRLQNRKEGNASSSVYSLHNNYKNNDDNSYHHHHHHHHHRSRHDYTNHA